MSINNIKTQIKNVVESIDSFNNKLSNYNNDKNAIIKNIDFTPETKKSKLEELQKSFAEKNKGVYDDINTMLSVLKDLAIEKTEAVLDITDEKLIKTIEFINAVNQNINDELLSDLIKPFIGTPKALTLFKNILITCGAKANLKTIDKYIQSIEPKIKYVDTSLYFAMRDFNNSATANIKKALETIDEIAEILGVEIESSEE